MMATDDDPGDLFEALAEVAPGAQFFGARQTMARSVTAVFAPLVADGRNFGQRTEGGPKPRPNGRTASGNRCWPRLCRWSATRCMSRRWRILGSGAAARAGRC